MLKWWKILWTIFWNAIFMDDISEKIYAQDWEHLQELIWDWYKWKLDLDDIDVCNVKDFSYCFSPKNKFLEWNEMIIFNERDIEAIQQWKFSKWVKFKWMFYKTESKFSIDFSMSKFSNAEDFSEMFMSSKFDKITWLTVWNKVKTVESMFEYSDIKFVDLNWFQKNNIQNFTKMIRLSSWNFIWLENINIKNWKYFDQMFEWTTFIYDLSKFDFKNWVSFNKMFSKTQFEIDNLLKLKNFEKLSKIWKWILY